MLIRMRATTSVAALAAGLLILSTPPAGALTMKECSAKYQAAKTSGALGGQSWSDFRKTQCGTNCLDQYKANKATNANGGLKWIEKGGGYYSECNKQLKG